MTASNATQPEKSDSTPTRPSLESSTTEPSQAKILNLTLPLLFIGTVAVIAGGGYWVAKNQQNTQLKIDNLRDSFEHRIASVTNDQRDFTSKIETEFANVTANVSELSNRFSGTGRDLIIAEVDYILQLANYRLQLEHDVGTAKMALEMADARLRTLTDPAFFEVRQRLAKDIAALEALNIVDITGLSLSLSELEAHVAAMPAKIHAPTNQSPERPQIEEALPSGFWERTFHQIWAALRSLMIIRHHDKPVTPLLPPEQEEYVKQNLQLKIEQARLAALQHNSKLFRANISQSIDWINQYFDTSYEPTQAYLAKLNQWRQLDVAPELPDIGQSARALDKAAKKVGFSLMPNAINRGNSKVQENPK